MTNSPFDHKQDRALGEALKALLSGRNEAGFVERVLAGVAEIQSGRGPRLSWWEVLSKWAGPGLVAAGVGLALVVTIWMSGRPGNPGGTMSLGDPLQPPDDSLFPAALLARNEPPNLNDVLLVGLEGR